MALSLPNSMHMAANFDLSDPIGNTTHFRMLAAYATPGINLKLIDLGEDDLKMSFFHIANLMDDNFPNLNEGSCGDCGDVQIRIDLDPFDGTDVWGVWQKLVPFQNVYDHHPDDYTYGYYYCLFTPTDTGTDPPAPRGVTETLCFPLGAWSHCGDDEGTSTADTFDCPGPGVLDPSGIGTWVETKFNLAAFLGARVQMRWIVNSWVWSTTGESYQELGGSTWGDNAHEDGWWLDNISIQGTVESQLRLITDPDLNCSDVGAPPGTCDALNLGDPCGTGGTCVDGPAAPIGCPLTGCNESVGPDNGTSPVLAVTDLDGTPIDGITRVAQHGEALRVTATGSEITGGCANGSTQYRFFKNGVEAQGWSGKTNLEDSPTTDATYSVLVRCSSDFSCTSTTGATASVVVYGGDGGNITLTAEHSTASVALSWDPRPQPAAVSGYDLFRGSVPGPDPTLGTLQSLLCDVPEIGPLEATDSAVPTVGTAFYYMVGHRSVSSPAEPINARTGLGHDSDGKTRVAGFECVTP
jgi:hypothetical protein